MQIPGQRQFNIFFNGHTQPNKNKALSFFPVKGQNQQDQGKVKQIITRRQNFKNEIRMKQKQGYRKNRRQQLLKSLQSNQFFITLESLATNSSIESKNLSNLLTDLRRNMGDYQFCSKLDQNNKIKQFILQIYIYHQDQLPLRQKAILVQSLIFLTYYGQQSLSSDQKQKLNQLLIKELSRIKIFSCEAMEYFRKIIDLLTNMTADQDYNINHYLMDSNILHTIVEKISQLSNQAQRALSQYRDEQAFEKYSQDLRDVRQCFVETLYNLSDAKYKNEFFFKFTVNQFVNDRNYLTQCGATVIKVFSNFFHEQKFRESFIQNSELVSWFQKFVFPISQGRFQDCPSKKYSMTEHQRQLFSNLLNCLLVLLDNEEDEAYHQSICIMVLNNLDRYLLAQFLIQSGGVDDMSSRKSVRVQRAIRMYEFLASDLQISLDQLLVVTSERTFQDILKVLLDSTYFTSCKVSACTLSVLNKMLSKDSLVLKSLMELRVLDSINDFLHLEMTIQSQTQIINFLELLTLMIAADDDIARQQKRTYNQLVRLLDSNGFVSQIERYQDHELRNVVEKTQAFLKFLDVTLSCSISLDGNLT